MTSRQGENSGTYPSRHSISSLLFDWTQKFIYFSLNDEFQLDKIVCTKNKEILVICLESKAILCLKAL